MLGIMSTDMAVPNGIAIKNNNNSSPGGNHYLVVAYFTEAT